MSTTSPAQPAAAAAPPRGVRVANLRLRRIDPFDAMKTGFVFALGLAIMWLVASVLIFLFADAAGVFDSFNSTFQDLSGNEGPFTATVFQVLAVNAVFAVVEVVVITLLVGVLAALYNAAAGVTGGIRVKLAED